jgi:thiol-disulfide isomerase/thioredoxin
MICRVILFWRLSAASALAELPCGSFVASVAFCRRWLGRLALFAGAAFTLVAQTAEAKLAIGDPPPKLQVGQWVQGEPVRQFDSNHIYVLDFWATWCGPCVASIPHLNDLAQKFKDKGVIFIGQNVWDSDDAVAPFVKKMGDKMTYRVALDDKSQDPDGFMASHWWKRHVEQHGIPTAFIINKAGRIAWIGHPVQLNEKLIEDIRTDQFDVTNFAEKYEKMRQEDKILGGDQDKLFHAMDAKKWDDASAALDDLLKQFPRFQTSFTLARFKILLGQKKFAAAWNFGETFSNTHTNAAGLENALAWAILAPAVMEERNLPLAEKLALHANETAQGKDPAILDTLARAEFMLGKKSLAIETEQKAASAAPETEKDSYRKTLSIYQQDKLPDAKE